MNEPLFTSTDAALRFAFSYSTEQYTPTPVARLMRGGPVGNGKGLVGVDGAGQAGMVRRELEDVSDLHIAILIAQFGPPHSSCDCGSPCCSRRRQNPEWNAALHYLADYTAGLFAGTLSNYRFRRALLERYFGARKDANGKKVSVERLSEEFGVHRQTAAKHNERLTLFLRGTKGVNGEVGEQAKAMLQIDGLLRDRGFVGLADAA